LGTTRAILAFTPYNDLLIAAGSFTSVGGVPANSIASWDDSSWLPVGTGIDNIVQALTVYDGLLVAAGRFSTAGGVTANHIAAWDGFSWSALGSGIEELPVPPDFPQVEASALTTYDSLLIVGGNFLRVGGVNSAGVSAWDGAAWRDIGLGGSNPQVLSTIVYDGQLVVAGDLSAAGGQPVQGIAAWDGSNWSALEEGLRGRTYGMTEHVGRLVVCGDFDMAGEVPASGIAVWDGLEWSAIDPGGSFGNACLTTFGDCLVVGGGFTELGGVPVMRIAAWDGVTWSPLGSGMDNWVSALTTRDDKLIAGGWFTTAGDKVSAYIASWNGPPCQYLSPCLVPEIIDYHPTEVTPLNCADGCAVRFYVDTQDDLSRVDRIILERRLPGLWVGEDSILAPVPPPLGTLTCVFDDHFSDGEHEFRVAYHCLNGTVGVSESMFVTAVRGVPVMITGFDCVYSMGTVALTWSIGGASELQGFNIYRSTKKETGFERINGGLVSPDGRNEYVDESVVPGETYWYRLGAVDEEGEWMSQTISLTVPAGTLALHQNRPNPFNPTTKISFVLPSASDVDLSIYDAQGKLVETMVAGRMEAGVKTYTWDGRDRQGEEVSSGVYFYRLTAGNRTLTKKMVLLK
jgi:hypothetical protein